MVIRPSDALANANSLPSIGAVGLFLVFLEVWSRGVAMNMSGRWSLLLAKLEVISDMASSTRRRRSQRSKTIGLPEN